MEFATFDDIIQTMKVVILPALATLVTYLGLKKSERKDREIAALERHDRFRDDILARLEALQAENDKLREDNASLVLEMAELKVRVIQLETEVNMLEIELQKEKGE